MEIARHLEAVTIGQERGEGGLGSECPLSSPLLIIIPGVLASAVRQEKKVKKYWGRKNTTVLVHKGYDCLCRKSKKNKIKQNTPGTNMQL